MGQASAECDESELANRGKVPLVIGLHELAEQRSLAIHRRVAARLREDPSLTERARQKLREWAQAGRMSPYYVTEWQRWFDGPSAALCDLLADPSEYARSLRQASPFVGIVDPKTRWDIWRTVREQSGR